MDLQIFIISWSGQHQNAAAMAQALDEYRNGLCVVFSDPNPTFTFDARCRTVRRPDHLFWSDKFLACIDACHADWMLVLHGDCQCGDWAGLVDRCTQALTRLPGLGVWAPLIRGTPFEIETTRIGRLTGTPYSLVTQTDAICFALPKSIRLRMKQADYASNVYGWGIARMMVANAYSRNMLVVVDESITVQHPAQRGYPSSEAMVQRDEFLQQLTIQETMQHTLLTSFQDQIRDRRNRPQE